jgi:tripartite-type tricarboxylate transporter receptor subunit TctC
MSFRPPRVFATLLLAAATTAVVVPQANAQSDWPAKPVRIVVPFAPGGATDVVARQLGQKLNVLWGQSVVIENRAGAGGNIGADVVAKAAPDGYTLLMTSGSIVTANPHLYKAMPFDAAKDLVGVTNVASGPQVIVVNPAVPAKTLAELVALAKARPGTINFGSAGVGTQTHLAAENFAATAGIDITHVPYKGEGPAIADLIGGQIQLATPNLAAALPHIQGGRLRALAVTTRDRSSQLPDVPAAGEILPGFENVGWFGLMVPAGTPPAVVEKIYADTAKVLAEPDMKSRLEGLGMAGVGNRPDAFARAIAEESKMWAQVVRQRKLSTN